MVKKPKKHWREHLRFDQYFLIFTVSLFFLVYPGENKYTQTPLVNAVGAVVDSLPEFEPSLLPQKKSWLPDPEVSARAAYIYEPDAGLVLYDKNANQKLAPASTTKLITALVALDYYQLDDVIEVRGLATDGKTMELFYGERMSVENLLYGALVHSANDAAFVLADNYPGGVDAFVIKMNEKGKELGLENSSFANPIGYDHPDQYVTARDLAILGLYVLNNPTLAHMVGTKAITVADASYTYFHDLATVNELLGEIPGVAGVKTGFTAEAGENLVTTVSRNGQKVMLVVLGSKDRFADTRVLIDWVFNGFEWSPIQSTLDQ
ncbi:hypothetical protein COW99_06060 [Candidatus Roizmanbacteria bacterium CG22_combo_CG10-13_8_21_14_all_38_20]|uniref:Peptidase S11 D-alanyl-D-alanine carboxypeptidase A N-terminal domain-containing protein n=1 Tax=Candidatus Roizmanbacteria bacterium CG22_combo_CG10-13_8_21_14_all_38_20 TaxID=1974862 RepID=A0A2H0BTP4_9BACT|nr:D-alanyl-D-alanine carboxypeptidase [Candidatus Microgenomates bacterium]PIP61056.1 MAG: hypothetical protein COW99_06060 [Candidatus Roizmanbacteria bacterium CG22_combo_CG10-13_8_21_14_all_38_20]PJC30842.1 MAG: hypothetical protein CO050_04725 [Candidatus Roizmanbacteria bacterium CG_4_9_14_0_2_um_filter_38_17]